MLTNDKEITLFSKVEDGKTYYSFASPYGMQSDDSSQYMRFAAPTKEGEVLQLSKDDAIWWEAIPYVSKDGKHYDYVYLKNRATGWYMKDTADSNNSLNLREPNRGEGGAIVTATTLDNPDDRRYLWQLTPMISTPPKLNLSLPQSGWIPKDNKVAVLSSATGVSAHYIVKDVDGTVLFEGDGIEWGKYWDDLYYYTLNLNIPALEQEGTYILDVAGIQKQFVIKDNVYLHPFRMYGSEQFDIDEIFSSDVGFVSQWGRLENWWPKPYEFLDSLEYWDQWVKKSPNTFPEWMWRDDTDANGNGLIVESYDGTKATKEEVSYCYKGAWEMTDQYAHNYAYDGLVLYRLTQMYKLANNDKLKDKIYKEIEYGVNGMLLRQEADGSWRQGYMDKLHWTGTSAGIGAGLSAAWPIVASRDATLGAKLKDAVALAWEFVSQRADDKTTWAVQNEGVLPGGLVLKSTPPTQRNLWRESYLLFVATLYDTTKEKQYQDILEKEIPSATIAYNGWFGIGQKLPGQFTAHGDWALNALLLYYPYASDKVKSHIEGIASYYYDEYIIKDDLVGGVYGAYGEYLKGYIAAYTWGVWKKMLASLQLYHTFGQKYAQGVLLAQKSMAWYWGSNPYSSSLVFGVGDFYINGGWGSYHTIGRHTSLESSGMHLKGYDGTYFSSETTVLGSLSLWYSAMLLDATRDTLKGVEFYIKDDFEGAKVQLMAGKYTKSRLISYGLDIANLHSIKVPSDFEVILYSTEDFSGDSITILQDSKSLSLTTNLASIEIKYHGKDSSVELDSSKENISTSDSDNDQSDDTKIDNTKTDNTNEVDNTINNTDDTQVDNSVDENTTEVEDIPKTNTTEDDINSTIAIVDNNSSDNDKEDSTTTDDNSNDDIQTVEDTPKVKKDSATISWIWFMLSSILLIGSVFRRE